MLWFIRDSATFLDFPPCISKHLMLWFIGIPSVAVKVEFLFQNILCYGLSLIKCPECGKGFSFQNILCYGLSERIGGIGMEILRFQNILCYGLSEKILKKYAYRSYFKTSYVMVYQKKRLSHRDSFREFKTSYVMVYRHLLSRLTRLHPISKHLMLWFIFYLSQVSGDGYYFKTSYVMVYLSLVSFPE